MLFMEEHAQAVHAAIQARRDACDAVLGCMSEPNIVKLTRIGRFNMDGSKRGALDFLKRLRGGKQALQPPAALISLRCCAASRVSLSSSLVRRRICAPISSPSNIGSPDRKRTSPISSAFCSIAMQAAPISTCAAR